MPQIKKVATQRFDLPSTAEDEDKAYVEIKLGLTAGDFIKINKGTTDADKTFIGICAMITAWNYTEEDGTPTPINANSIQQLGLEDFTFISEKLTAIMTGADSPVDAGEKKTSNSGLVPPTPVSLPQ